MTKLVDLLWIVGKRCMDENVIQDIIWHKVNKIKSKSLFKNE